MKCWRLKIISEILFVCSLDYFAHTLSYLQWCIWLSLQLISLPIPRALCRTQILTLVFPPQPNVTSHITLSVKLYLPLFTFAFLHIYLHMSSRSCHHMGSTCCSSLHISRYPIHSYLTISYLAHITYHTHTPLKFPHIADVFAHNQISDLTGVLWLKKNFQLWSKTLWSFIPSSLSLKIPNFQNTTLMCLDNVYSKYPQQIQEGFTVKAALGFLEK